MPSKTQSPFSASQQLWNTGLCISRSPVTVKVAVDAMTSTFSGSVVGGTVVGGTVVSGTVVGAVVWAGSAAWG